MKPFLHARVSARRFGGKPSDYLDIHNLLDFSKAGLPDMRHRIFLHNSIGCYVVEQAFGVTRVNSDGREYSTRDVAEQHIIDDLGTIPTLEKCLQGVPLHRWLGGPRRTVRHQFGQPLVTAVGESIESSPTASLPADLDGDTVEGPFVAVD